MNTTRTTSHRLSTRIVASVALGAAVAAAAGCSASNSTKVKTSNPKVIEGNKAKSPVPIYDIAHPDTSKQWDDGANGRCDPATGQLRLPFNLAPPCTPVFSGNNGGAQGIGVSGDTIKIARYVAKPDISSDYLTKSSGTYDEPKAVAATYQGYVKTFERISNLYGRKIELVDLQGTGLSNDETAALADAKTAKDMGVFAVLGGPAQTKSFSRTLAQEKILCIGSCLIAQPAEFYKETHPYVWPGMSPDESAALNIEFVSKQLEGKLAQYAGDAKYKTQKRRFVILNYDTAEGAFTKVWDDWEAKLKAKGVNVVGRVPFRLNVATVSQDAIPVVQKLKALDATTVIFTGDPFTPQFFTKEATKQNYFPEWVLSGTVFADTSAFARQFDQKQWSHAFGMNLIPSRIPRKSGEPYSVYVCGIGHAPEAENSQAIIMNNVAILMTGLNLAGPKLTPESFRDGLWAAPLPKRDAGHIRGVVSFGNHGIWPDGTDFGGSDDTALAWWDPNAVGEDETGAPGKGLWRYVNNGAHFLPGEIPTAPIAFFDKANTVTYFSDSVDAANGIQAIPDALKPIKNGKCI